MQTSSSVRDSRMSTPRARSEQQKAVLNQQTALQAEVSFLTSRRQRQDHVYAVAKRQYSELPKELQRSSQVDVLSRALWMIESDPESTSKVSIRLERSSRHAISIEKYIAKRETSQAEHLLRKAGSNLGVTEKFIDQLNQALNAFKNVQLQAWNFRHQIPKIREQVEGFRTTISILKGRYNSLYPPIRESPELSISAKMLCDDELGDSPIKQTLLQTMLSCLSEEIEIGEAAALRFDLIGSRKAWEDGERLFRKIVAYIKQLREAVDAHCQVQRMAEQEVRREMLYQTGACDVADAYHSDSDFSYQAPLNRDVIFHARSFQRGATTHHNPAMHHPRPESMSPKSALKKWLNPE